jgi:vacuolar-type H+-ATPase subunit E/Vma4
MTAPGTDGPELLRREVLEEARRQADEILRSAGATADQLIAKAEQETEQARQGKLEAARSEAKRRQEAILATVPVDANRTRLARTEQLLRSIYDQARDQLRRGGGIDRRRVLIGLAVEALARMSGNAFGIRVSSADLRAFGDGTAEEIRRRLARPLLNVELGEDPEAKDGDWILQDADGRQMWDLGLESRLDRLWPDLRRQIAAQAGLVEKDEVKAAES